MAIRTWVGRSTEDRLRMQDDLVTSLAGHGVLHCAGVASALLDIGEAVAERDRPARRDQDEEVGPGAP